MQNVCAVYITGNTKSVIGEVPPDSYIGSCRETFQESGFPETDRRPNPFRKPSLNHRFRRILGPGLYRSGLHDQNKKFMKKTNSKRIGFFSERRPQVIQTHAGALRDARSTAPTHTKVIAQNEMPQKNNGKETAISLRPTPFAR